eukprot:CAMPEP_0202000372 /NCGR_PEP_ID=MMETSP0905-20130828/6730_1 /ASSEMBLY_ACC=CAM_ASM_000554 /TAXON_ID=420261 /ORGANISM="Thalassiosira antarctica, Strain CCMP982" /LENGTH=67 /DNA_ID=CAMNT_0048556823 /DNA_START=286 /DNA_END=486 /DNA_ORIENTATION=+
MSMSSGTSSGVGGFVGFLDGFGVVGSEVSSTVVVVTNDDDPPGFRQHMIYPVTSVLPIPVTPHEGAT